MRVRSILFECTWRCNQACRFCYNAWQAPDSTLRVRPEPSTRQTERVLAEVVRQTGCRQIAFTGGEPTLRRDLVDLVAFARRSGATVSLLSNGSDLDVQHARDLRRVGLGLVQLTFCGLSAVTHDALCGAGTFARTFAAIDAVRSAGLKLGLTFVATRENLAEVPRFVELAGRLRQKKFLLNRFNPGGRGLTGETDLLPTLAELRSLLKAADAAAARVGVTPFLAVPIMPCLVRATDYPHLRLAQGCSAGTDKAYYTVDAWGDVRFCNHTPTILGNLLKTPFEQLAASPELKRFRDTRPPFCEPCPGWARCRGGCRAAAEQVTGAWSAEDPLLRAALDRGELRAPDREGSATGGQP